MGRWILFTAWFWGSIAAAAGAEEARSAAAPLTNAIQILALRPENAEPAPSVRVRGFITCYHHGSVLFVQDQTAGVFVFHLGERLPFKVGDFVEVTGLARMGRYSPYIHAPKIEAAEPDPAFPKPAPRLSTLAEIDHGGLDAQYVEVCGVVRSRESNLQHLALGLADPPHRIYWWTLPVEGAGELPPTGSRVCVRGVVGTLTESGKLEGFQLIGNSVDDIRVVEPGAPGGFELPLSRASDLSHYYTRNTPGGLVRLVGTVVGPGPDNSLFIQDSSGAVRLTGPAVPGDLPPGVSVEAVGSLGPLFEPARIEEAVVRVLATNAPVPAPRVAPESLEAGGPALRLVEIEGRVLGFADSLTNQPRLVLKAGRLLLTGVLPGAVGWRELEPGCQVRVTGVFQPSLTPAPAVFGTLYLRTAADLQVIGGPAGARRGSPWVAVWAAVAAAAAGLGAWLVLGQRRRTAKVLQLQAALQTEMRSGEQQLRRAMQERERIGRDLHDDIIQSIYAVGLNLENCRRMARQQPTELEPRLTSAIGTLNDTIRSVRGFIAGLEPKILNGREFKTALKSLALTSGDGPTQFTIDVDTASANALTSTQATQLLHIAKEAMSNSLRHAHASSVNVTLKPEGAGTLLEIADDGVGFEANNPGHRRQGLNNIAARARELGANLEISSEPGNGCRIVLSVPPNESE